MELNEINPTIKKKSSGETLQIVLIFSWNAIVIATLGLLVFFNKIPFWTASTGIFLFKNYTDDTSEIEQQRDDLLLAIKYSIVEVDAKPLVLAYNNVVTELDREDEIIQFKQSRR